MSPGRLREPALRALFHHVYVRADLPVDIALCSRAAFLLVGGGAWWVVTRPRSCWGAACGPRDAPAEVIVPGGRQRTVRGLRVCRERLDPDEVTDVDGIGVTSPIRTACDLARREPRIEAVVAIDALARVHRFAPEEVLATARRHPGARGNARLPRLVESADAGSGSPMETRIRTGLHDHGLPAPVLHSTRSAPTSSTSPTRACGSGSSTTAACTAQPTGRCVISNGRRT